jgi:hypothetical protein
MYVPQVGIKTMLDTVVYDNQDPINVNKGKGNVAKNNSVASVELDDTTLGIFEK